MKNLITKAKELLKYNSKEFVLNKLIDETKGKTSKTNVIKAVETALTKD